MTVPVLQLPTPPANLPVMPPHWHAGDHPPGSAGGGGRGRDDRGGPRPGGGGGRELADLDARERRSST